MEKIVPKYVERIVENPYYVDNVVEIDEGEIENYKKSNRVDGIMPTEVNR